MSEITNEQLQGDLNIQHKTMEHSDRTRRDLEMMLLERNNARLQINKRGDAIIAEAEDCDAAIRALEIALNHLNIQSE